ncbi:hypothetical protein theurythT_17350 [Thalassotalea eurytherma]|uniref:Uncharacterized protein n=1 Tax=Thalassotalea eurytherma TaxID=1144278 RepID=A0ABQ6H271_9GAMM|nr:hypothetical protein theurythT_17350 [Thalassotalea eurytherma]
MLFIDAVKILSYSMLTNPKDSGVVINIEHR